MLKKQDIQLIQISLVVSDDVLRASFV